MKLLKIAVLALIGIAVFVVPLLAHHSTNNMYDESKTVEVSGKVVEWRMVNPHPYLVVEVTGPDGKVERWDLSFGGSAVAPLRRQGYTPQTFKVGEIIHARGNPARSATTRGILIRGGLTRQDGSAIP